MTLLRRQDVLRLLLSSAILQAVLHHRLVLRVLSPVLPALRPGLHHRRPARPALRRALQVLRPRCVLQVRRHAVPAVLTSPVRAHPRHAVPAVPLRYAVRVRRHRPAVPVPHHRCAVQAHPHRCVARAHHPSPVLPAQGHPDRAPLLRCAARTTVPAHPHRYASQVILPRYVALSPILM